MRGFSRAIIGNTVAHRAADGGGGGETGEFNPEPNFDAEPSGAELNGVEITGGLAVAASGTGPLVIPAAIPITAGACDLTFQVSAMEAGIGNYVRAFVGGQPIWTSYETEFSTVTIWLGGVENQNIELRYWNMGEESIDVDTFSVFRWGEVPPLLPTTLDFKNGAYDTAFGGSHINQVVGAPDGYAFNPSISLSPDGLVAGSPCINAAILEQMDPTGDGFTLVAEFNVIGSDGPTDAAAVTFWFSTSAGGAYRYIAVAFPSSDLGGDGGGIEIADTGGLPATDKDVSLKGLGAFKLAFSMSSAGLSASYCGRPVVVVEEGEFTGDPPPDSSWHILAFQITPGGAMTAAVEKITITAKVEDSELPALSYVPINLLVNGTFDSTDNWTGTGGFIDSGKLFMDQGTITQTLVGGSLPAQTFTGTLDLDDNFGTITIQLLGADNTIRGSQALMDIASAVPFEIAASGEVSKFRFQSADGGVIDNVTLYSAAP